MSAALLAYDAAHAAHTEALIQAERPAPARSDAERTAAIRQLVDDINEDDKERRWQIASGRAEGVRNTWGALLDILCKFSRNRGRYSYRLGMGNTALATMVVDKVLDLGDIEELHDDENPDATVYERIAFWRATEDSGWEVLSS